MVHFYRKTDGSEPSQGGYTLRSIFFPAALAAVSVGSIFYGVVQYLPAPPDDAAAVQASIAINTCRVILADKMLGEVVHRKCAAIEAHYRVIAMSERVQKRVRDAQIDFIMDLDL